MSFIDEAIITVQSGKGGRGCVSFRREKFVPRGGPDGGDGGKGGDVVIRASAHKRTLQDFRYKRQFKAENGGYGEGAQRSGRDGETLIIEVPPGTVISDAESGEVIADLAEAEASLIIAKGGRGGRGNKRFTTATNRAPRFAQPGESGEERTLRLELKLLADIGLVGLPNAGKSTLISVISAAAPKIASYPFTTLSPVLGVVRPDWGEPFVVADIPGLIEGAHEGAGLGIQFLRHVERTRALIHLIDASVLDPADPLLPYRTVQGELSAYDPALLAKPQIVVLNKMDIPEAVEGASAFTAAAGFPVMTISAAAGSGVEDLKHRMAALLDTFHEDHNP